MLDPSQQRFESVYREHLPRVLRVALQSVHRRDIAEDIASETFLALFRNFQAFDGRPIATWLVTVARNRARDYWRHWHVEQRPIGSAVHACYDPPGISPLECPLLASVHRRCLWLHYVYGMTVEEIARESGESSTQVKGHLQYGRQLLRDYYRKAPAQADAD